MKEHLGAVRKEAKRALEDIKEELRGRMMERVEVLEETLRVVDSKIEYVVESCDTFISRISCRVEDAATRYATIEREKQMTMEICGRIEQRIAVLEERALKQSQKECEWRNQLESMKQENIRISCEYEMVVGGLSENISDLKS